LNSLKGAHISRSSGIQEAILEFLRRAVEEKIFDAVIIPMRVPADDAFVYVFIKDSSLLKDAVPLPPTMFIQGAKAVSSVTRLGEGTLKIVAIMRPCEIRAVLELAKLGQIHLENITLMSIDCPGVLPTTEFLKDPIKNRQLFDKVVLTGDDSKTRPVCQICDKSSMVAGDLHIASLGTQKDTLFILSNSQKGNNIMDKLDIKLHDNIESWQKKVASISEEKRKRREKAHIKLKATNGGLENLLDTFSYCINCHNCMRVCPVCYCRLCYFDSDNVKHTAEEYLQRAEKKGSMRFLPDTIFFHIGRMSHMSLSCVSCGSCEDACPMSIPVAQLFSLAADETQGLFDYVSGRSLEEPIPLIVYKEEELQQMEDGHE
jgi:formate dehydrogenase subunit beta